MKSIIMIIVSFLLVNPCFADCQKFYTHVEDPEDRTGGYFVDCPKCNGGNTITRYFDGNKLVEEECNECNYDTGNEVKKEIIVISSKATGGYDVK